MEEKLSYQKMIEDGYQKAKKNLDKDNFTYVNSNYINWSFLAILAILLLSLIIYILVHYANNTIYRYDIYRILGILGGTSGIVIIIWGIVWYINNKKKTKILKFFDFDEIYKKAFEEISDIKGQFIAINNTIDMNLKRFEGSARADNILHFRNAGTRISVGTVTTKIVDSNGDSHYFCYRVMKVKLDKDLNIKATLKPRGVIFRRDNVDVESSEFEWLFDTYATDQIIIRRILTPKVIENLTSLSEGSTTKIPKIKIDNDTISFVFPRFSVRQYKDPESTIRMIDLKNPSLIVEEINQKVINDYAMVKEIVKWFEALDLINE